MPDLTKKQTAALLAIDAGARAGTPLRQSNTTSETTVYWQQCQGLERAGLLEPINGFGDLTLTDEGVRLAAELRGEPMLPFDAEPLPLLGGAT